VKVNFCTLTCPLGDAFPRHRVYAEERLQSNTVGGRLRTQCYVLSSTQDFSIQHLMPTARPPLSPIVRDIPAPQKQEHQIRRNECRQNAQIPPSMIEAEAQRLVELIAPVKCQHEPKKKTPNLHFICTIPAGIGRILQQIPSPPTRKEILHILTTRLPTRRRE
jgi:hypothetical protein